MIASVLIIAVYFLCSLLEILIVAEAIMSWFVMAMPYQLRRVYEFIQMITEPVVRPFRKLTVRFTYSMGIDFSPVFALLAVQLVQRLLSWLIFRIAY